MVFLYAAIALLSFCSMVSAHDIYRFLADPSGESCCRSGDCRPAAYRFTPEGVQMLVNGAWHTVPANRIIYRTLPGDTGETKGGHWCGAERRQHRPMQMPFFTYCAVLPPTLSLLTPSYR
jgi:hypothetical protein